MSWLPRGTYDRIGHLGADYEECLVETQRTSCTPNMAMPEPFSGWNALTTASKCEQEDRSYDFANGGEKDGIGRSQAESADKRIGAVEKLHKGEDAVHCQR